MVKFTPLFFLALGAPLLAVRGDAYGSVASVFSSLPSSGSSAYSLASDSSSKSVYGSSSDSFSGSGYESSSGSSSVPVYGSASEAAPSRSSSVPIYGSASEAAPSGFSSETYGSSSSPTSGSTSDSKESAYEPPSGSSSAGSANCTLDATIPTQCDGSDNWWPVSVVGKGTYCTLGPSCAGTEGSNCPVPQDGLNFGSQCIVLSKTSGVRGCIPKSYCGEVLPEPEEFYGESGSQETTPEVQTTAPEGTPSVTPSAKCDVDLDASVSPAPTYPSGDVPTGTDQTPTPVESVPTAYGGTETTEPPASRYDTEAPSSDYGPVDSAPAPLATGYVYVEGSDFNGDYSGSDFDGDYSGSAVDGDYSGSTTDVDYDGSNASDGSMYDGKNDANSYSSETDGFYPVEETAAPSTDPVSAYGSLRTRN